MEASCLLANSKAGSMTCRENVTGVGLLGFHDDLADLACGAGYLATKANVIG